ncbi:MAG: 30S ribosomal protein S16 [Chloroflexi bacterium]|nr:30S ribosomal protein S16 [Chloroflexota bacterium]
MLRIRLRRVGAKKHPAYRIVVADSRTPRNGSFVDQVGHYDPMTNPPTVLLDDAKLQDWVKKGAQPSESVQRIIKSRETPKEGVAQGAGTG